MKKMILVVILLAQCSNPLRKLERETILKRAAKVENFRGRYTETGTADLPLQISVAASRNPPQLLSKVISRGSASGATLHYEKNTLSLYYPQSTFGIRFRNLPAPTAEQEIRFMENEYDWHVQHYDIKQSADSQVAGIKTRGLVYTPKGEFAASPYLFQWQTQVAEDFAFPLKNEMFKSGRQLYAIEFTDIAFNAPAGDFNFSFPVGATIAEYDLASTGLTIVQAKKGANFTLVIPAESENIRLKKIIRVKGIIPAYSLIFEQMPYLTTYTQVKDYGLKLVPEVGLKISGKREYRITFGGTFKTVNFMNRGVYNTVVSNLPLSEILEWLDAGVNS